MNAAQSIAVLGSLVVMLCAVQVTRSTRPLVWSAAFIACTLGTAFLGAMFLGA